MSYIVPFLIGGAFGIIPFAYLIARLKGIDLKETGSGNIGATNLGRACGPIYFVLGFLLDGLKGLIPVLMARSFSLSAACAGAGAIIGHVFNPLFNFKGGKGVSTMIGVTVGLSPMSFGIALACWLIIYLITNFVSLASIFFALALPVVAFLLTEGHLHDRIFITLMSLLIIVAHHSNIKRLIMGKEPKTILWRKV